MNNCTGFLEGNWSRCCARHDKRYESSRLTRYQADILLYRCTKKKCKIVAPIMFIGVRLFGWYFYKRSNTVYCTVCGEECGSEVCYECLEGLR